jgi:hypothetical protein
MEAPMKATPHFKMPSDPHPNGLTMHSSMPESVSEQDLDNMKLPDDDTLEELNLPKINTGLVKDLVKRNMQALREIKGRDSAILPKLASKM